MSFGFLLGGGRREGLDAAKEVVLADRGKKRTDGVRRVTGEEEGLVERSAREFDARSGRSPGTAIVVRCVGRLSDRPGRRKPFLVGAPAA